MLTQVIVTFRSAPVCSHISCHWSASTTFSVGMRLHYIGVLKPEWERLRGKILTVYYTCLFDEV